MCKLPSSIDLSALAASLGEPIRAATPLARGATCEVWKVETEMQAYALRLFTGRPPRCGLEREIALRRRLAKAGAAVAQSVASSLELPATASNSAWALDLFIEGETYSRGAVPAEVARDLGATLALLHGLPVEALGPPATPLDGVLARFDDPLPVDLRRHAIANAAPDLTESLAAPLAALRRKVESGTPVLCHSDLHEGQLICRNGRLAALIDFGEAALLDRRWDFASFCYFHGPEILVPALEGYSGETAIRRALAKDARIFSIGIALHHATRARLPGKEHRLAVAADYLRRLLPQLKN